MEISDPYITFMYPDLDAVQAHEDFTLELSYANGELRSYDMKPLLDSYPFSLLNHSYGMFQLAHVDGDTVVWNDLIDIAPEELYHNSTRLNYSK